MTHIDSFEIFEGKNTFVNPNTFNMEEWYGKLNKVFFGNSLKKVDMRWTNSKKELGVVRYDEKSGKIEYLGLSNKFKLTKSEQLSVLAHEMIHVWEIQKNKKAGHQKPFKDKMVEINKKSKWGIEVLVTQPMEHLKSVNPDSDTEIGFLMIKKKTKDFDIAKFDPSKTDPNNLIEILKTRSGKISVEIRHTTNGVINKFKKMSTNSELVTYKIDEVAFNTLMNDSKKIRGIKL